MTSMDEVFCYFLHVEDLLIAMGWLYNTNNFFLISFWLCVGR
jgi:hypothetical protein